MRAAPADALLAAFERLSARAPSAPLVFERAKTFSVGDVGNLARRFETALRAANLPENAVLGLQMANGVPFLAALLAARRAGHPVALLDAHSRSTECCRIAGALGLAAVIRGNEGGETDLPDVIVDRYALESTASQLGPAAAVIKLTSGSTGQPRGVVVSADALLADDEALRRTMGIGSGDRLLAMVPFSHSYGLSSLVVPALVAGLPLVVAPSGDPFGPLRAAAQWEATIFPTVPAYLTALLRLGEPPPLPLGVRRVIVAGAPLSPEVAGRFHGRTGRAAHVFYGASECGGITYDREGEAAERGTVGEVVEGVAIELEPVAGLAPTEGARLVVSSPAVAETYWPDSEPSLAGGRFATGDLARRAGREVALLGRLDDLINVRGRKVRPREVEGVIAGLPGVEDVVVRGVADNSSGREAIGAYIACAAGALTTERVVRWCRERLAEHKVPRSVVLVRELPRTARGKLEP
ncbi:MAG: class I adenylate-forming enzyme family protein, partial [Thermoanaerobaculia bacterium]